MADKPLPVESEITIGGVPLDSFQSMTLRVAVTHYNSEMSDPDALGKDKHGRSMVKGYRQATNEILDLIFKAMGQ